tara:strand:- start:8816 stop:10090 length:1275 start_codon:yes stop_codon:yes gene_type:complete
MSVYTSAVTTKFIDPVFDRKNFRSEFRLQANTAYLSNMRLTGLGVASSSGTDRYNGLTGVLSSIDSIQLYDGNEMLDQLLEASQWNGFASYRNSNDKNYSLNRYLRQTGLGYISKGVQDIDATVGNVNRLVMTEPKIALQNDEPPNQGTKGWVSLKEMFPFLAASVVVPTNVYKRLRLVVNWKSVAQLAEGAMMENTATHSTLEECVLVVDELQGPVRDQEMREYKGVQYRPVEHDRVIVNAVAGTSSTDTQVEQSNKYTINGYNNKTLHNLTVVQTPLDKDTWQSSGANTEYSNQSSISQWKPTYQFRVNGSNKLSRNGWSGKNSRLGHLTDVYGECNTIPGNNQVWLDEAVNTIGKAASRVGTLDYTSVKIEDRISELQIEFGRTGVFANAITTQALALNFYGEVDKAIVLQKSGGYTIVYN